MNTRERVFIEGVRVGGAKAGREALAAFDAAFPQKVAMPERKTVWRWQHTKRGILAKMIAPRAHFFNSPDEANAYANEHFPSVKREYRLVRVYADNIDEIVPEQPEPCACPVCGKVPEVTKNNCGWYVMCTHKNTPQSRIFNLTHDDHRPTRDEAIAAWNVMKK